MNNPIENLNSVEARIANPVPDCSSRLTEGIWQKASGSNFTSDNIDATLNQSNQLNQLNQLNSSRHIDLTNPYAKAADLTFKPGEENGLRREAAANLIDREERFTNREERFIDREERSLQREARELLREERVINRAARAEERKMLRLEREERKFERELREERKRSGRH